MGRDELAGRLLQSDVLLDVLAWCFFKRRKGSSANSSIPHPRPGGQLQREAGGCSTRRGAKSFISIFYLFLCPSGNLNFLLSFPSQPNDRKSKASLENPV